MSQEHKHLIEEAARLGIVEGAVVRSAMEPMDRTIETTVTDPSIWTFGNSGIINGYVPGKSKNVYLRFKDRWAEVIEGHDGGLRGGDVVECGPAMRAALIELARGMGLEVRGETDGDPNVPKG